MSTGQNHVLIFNLLEGLRTGLSRFSGPTRTAMILATRPGEPMLVYDYQGLLEGHEDELRAIYTGTDSWKFDTMNVSLDAHPAMRRIRSLDLPGLVSSGGGSSAAFYHMWFAEELPNSCTTGPTGVWLGYAAQILSHMMSDMSWVSGGSEAHRRSLEAYAVDAIAHHLILEARRLKAKSVPDVNSALYAISKISTSIEEGARAEGRLLFMNPDYFRKFPLTVRFERKDSAHLDNARHVRKLLTTVEGSDWSLVCDGERIAGLTSEAPPHHALVAEFDGGRGEVILDAKPVCSFADGEFHSTRLRPNLEPLRRRLPQFIASEAMQRKIMRVMTRVAEDALYRRHGCTIVLDLTASAYPVPLSGQRLAEPLDLDNDQGLDIAAAMAKVDGALHVDHAGRLLAFACLLDGRSASGESRARGARYNSALRFSAAHDKYLALVVSSDGPIAIFSDGRDLAAPDPLPAVEGVQMTPPTLEEWLAGSRSSDSSIKYRIKT